MKEGVIMQLTTLCYIEKEDKYLMLHRVKKEVDINKDKWIGVGGKFEEGECPEECLLREVKEETGYTLTDYQFRGIVTFISDSWVNESMHLFTATGFEGEQIVCDEGELVWVKKDKLMELNLWEGDKIFLELLQKEQRFFSLKLVYEGDTLVEQKLKIYG
jgi:8-oxo-dGTP diphosphatase